MSRRWVINASPLIILAKVAYVSLISEMCEEVIVPAGVVQIKGLKMILLDLG